MDNKILIKNKMNEILRGDTDMLARKYIGRSADNMRMKEKEKILADIYMSFDNELKKNKKVKSDAQLRIEEIDNEMKNIRNGDRDELLGAHIKNYDPTMSNKDKDEILGKIYDGLQDERNKLDKEPTIITPPEPPENPKLTTLPDESVTVGAEVKPLSNTSGYSGEKRTPRGMTDLDIEANMKEILHGDTDTFLENNAEMYGFAYDPDMSAVEKEDILGCIYDILTEERRKLKAGEYDVKPENPSVEETKALDEKMSYMQTITEPVNEKMSTADVRQQALNSTDRDTFLENHQDIYGYYYNDNMSETEKNDLYWLAKTSVEQESNDAQSDAKKVWDANYATKWIKNNVYDVQKGDFDINFTYNTLLEQQAYAWAEYLNSGSEYDREIADLWDLAEAKFLADNDVGNGNFLTNTVASAAPGYINNVKAGATTAVIGGIGGLVFAGPAGVIPAAKYGFATGAAMDNGVKNSGVAYKALLAAGIPADIAVSTAKIDGVSSAIAEFVMSCATNSITGKIPSKIIAEITGEVAGKLGGDVAELIGDKLSQLHVQYEMND